MLQWLKDLEPLRSEVTFLSHEKTIWVPLLSYEGQPAANATSERTIEAQKEGAHVMMAGTSDTSPVMLMLGLIVTRWDGLL